MIHHEIDMLSSALTVRHCCDIFRPPGAFFRYHPRWFPRGHGVEAGYGPRVDEEPQGSHKGGHCITVAGASLYFLRHLGDLSIKVLRHEIMDVMDRASCDLVANSTGVLYRACSRRGEIRFFFKRSVDAYLSCLSRFIWLQPPEHRSSFFDVIRSEPKTTESRDLCL